MFNRQDNFFNSPCPNLTFNGANTHSAGPSLLPPSLMAVQAPAFSLGLDLKLPTPDVSCLNQATISGMSTAIAGRDGKDINNISIGKKHASLGVVTGTVKVFAKDYIPSSVKAGGMLISAATAGKKLSERIQDSLDGGMTPSEAYTCETARTLSEELSGKIIKGSIVGGIPPYLAAAAANPALAATVPVVLPMLPDAYNGAQIAAEVVGNTINQACHNVFESARELSQGAKP